MLVSSKRWTRLVSQRSFRIESFSFYFLHRLLLSQTQHHFEARRELETAQINVVPTTYTMSPVSRKR